MDAPTKLKLELRGDSSKHVLGCGGNCCAHYALTYILQPCLKNGQPYWITKDEYRAIWWSESKWRVGHFEDLGQVKCQIEGPVKDQTYPHLIKSGWTFTCYKGSQDVSNAVIFHDCSNLEGD